MFRYVFHTLPFALIACGLGYLAWCIIIYIPELAVMYGIMGAFLWWLYDSISYLKEYKIDKTVTFFGVIRTRVAVWLLLISYKCMPKPYNIVMEKHVDNFKKDIKELLAGDMV